MGVLGCVSFSPIYEGKIQLVTGLLYKQQIIIQQSNMVLSYICLCASSQSVWVHLHEKSLCHGNFNLFSSQHSKNFLFKTPLPPLERRFNDQDSKY